MALGAARLLKLPFVTTYHGSYNSRSAVKTLYNSVMTRGDITIQRARADHLEIALDKLVSTGATVDELADGVRVRCSDRPRAVDVVTLPYPGFPTDLQPQFIALNSIARGAASIVRSNTSLP